MFIMQSYKLDLLEEQLLLYLKQIVKERQLDSGSKLSTHCLHSNKQASTIYHVHYSWVKELDDRKEKDHILSAYISNNPCFTILQKLQTKQVGSHDYLWLTKWAQKMAYVLPM